MLQGGIATCWPASNHSPGGRYWYFNQSEQAKATEKTLPVVRTQLRVQEAATPNPLQG